MKYLILFILVAKCFGQAGTPTTFGVWSLLNEASDVNSNDRACYNPAQINIGFHNTTITMLHSVGAFSCGCTGGLGSVCTGTQTITQDYKSGSIIWKSMSIGPSSTGSPTINCAGPCSIEAMIKTAAGWTAFWLLGIGCQPTSPLTWDNINTCHWPQDTPPNGQSGEIDAMEQSGTPPFTSMNSAVYANSATPTVVASSTFTDATANFHLYHVDWSTTQVCFSVDNGIRHCESSQVPQQPMFVIIENRINSTNVYSGTFPVTVTVQYMQACAGINCTAPDAGGGNTLFVDDFSGIIAAPAVGMFADLLQ